MWTTARGGVAVRVRKNTRSPGQGFGGLDETDSVAGGAKTTEDFERDGKQFASRCLPHGRQGQPQRRMRRGAVRTERQ